MHSNKLFIYIVSLVFFLTVEAPLYPLSHEEEVKSRISEALQIIKKATGNRLTEDDRRQLIALPVDAIPVLTEMLNSLPDDEPDHPAFDLLALKFGLLEDQIPEPELSRAIDALLAKTLIGEKWVLRRKAVALAGIKNTRIKEAVARIRSDQSVGGVPETTK